jgi:hypothetical protein
MKVKLNPMFEQVSGQLGDVVFRVIRGKVFASRKSAYASVPSEEQADHRERFKLAVAYGRGAMGDEDMHSMYESAAKERDLPIFAVMIADYFNAPTIHKVDLSGYNGQDGNVIDVTVTDDFAVASVFVKISDGQGNVLESGFATENIDSTSRWYYSARANVSVPVTIEVVAKDYPGGATIQTVSKSF